MPRENLKGNTPKVPEVGKKKGGREREECVGIHCEWDSSSSPPGNGNDD